MNWLNQIIGYSEMLTEEADSSGQERLAGDLSNINSAAQQMLERLETLLSVPMTTLSKPSLTGHWK